MSGPLTLLRQSLSNPAWMRAKLAERAIKDPKEIEDVSQLLKYLEAQREISPERAFSIRQATEKGVPTNELLQERLPGFAGGGLAKLFQFVTPERLDSLLHEFGYAVGTPRSKGGLSWVSARDYLNATSPEDQLAQIIKDAGKFDPKRFQREQQYPFLMSNSLTEYPREITGHEGRHRIAAAMMENGGDFDLPVVLRRWNAAPYGDWRKARGSFGGQEFSKDRFGWPLILRGTEPIDYENMDALQQFLLPGRNQRFKSGGLAHVR